MKAKSLLGLPLSGGELARFSKSLKDSEEKRKRLEKQKTERVDLVVGQHQGCGGDIRYHSEFVIAVSRSEIRFGGSNPTREECSCSCVKCGVMFAPSFPAYRGQVDKHRAR